MGLDNRAHFLYIEGMEYITSDLHFGHSNILKYCPQTRPFNSVEEMDEALIRAWNSHVTDADTTFLLGDISYHGPEKTAEILNSLAGSKILVVGNHDNRNIKSEIFRSCFTEIHNYLELKRNKRHVVMFHFPIANWNRMSHGSIHFHGHLHGDPSPIAGLRAMDVGYDATGRIVIPLEEAISVALRGKVVSHHG